MEKDRIIIPLCLYPKSETIHTPVTASGEARAVSWGVSKHFNITILHCNILFLKNLHFYCCQASGTVNLRPAPTCDSASQWSVRPTSPAVAPAAWWFWRLPDPVAGKRAFFARRNGSPVLARVLRSRPRLSKYRRSFDGVVVVASRSHLFW
jgi:hypothetical protein